MKDADRQLILDTIDRLDALVGQLGQMPTYLGATRARTACRDAVVELDRLVRFSALQGDQRAG